MQHVTTGWHSLSDDPLRHILTYVPVHECRRVPGVVSRALRATATSPALSRARFCEPYTLHGDRHGVVHAMATAMGTRQWPIETIPSTTDDIFDAIFTGPIDAVAPPPALSIAIERGPDAENSNDDDESFVHGVVDPVLDLNRDALLSTGAECSLPPGSLMAYTLPFKLALSHFRFAFGCCNASNFRFWVFEAFDSEQDGWRVLYDSAGVSPWDAVRGPTRYEQSGDADRGTDPYWANEDGGTYKLFAVDAAFASSRFRIRLTDGDVDQCMHIRGLELFGTILPPWRIE